MLHRGCRAKCAAWAPRETCRPWYFLRRVHVGAQRTDSGSSLPTLPALLGQRPVVKNVCRLTHNYQLRHRLSVLLIQLGAPARYHRNATSVPSTITGDLCAVPSVFSRVLIALPALRAAGGTGSLIENANYVPSTITDDLCAVLSAFSSRLDCAASASSCAAPAALRPACREECLLPSTSASIAIPAFRAAPPTRSRLSGAQRATTRCAAPVVY